MSLTELQAERDAAIALFEAAQAALSQVQPETLRRPLWFHFAAKLELVRAHRTLLGLPVNHTLDMARAITGGTAST